MAIINYIERFYNGTACIRPWAIAVRGSRAAGEWSVIYVSVIQAPPQFMDYNGTVRVHSPLLNVVLHD